MSTNCNLSTTIVPDNSPLECDQYYSTKCIIHPNALAFLSLPENSTQFDINSAILLALINANNKIIQLQNTQPSGGFENKQLNVYGDYYLTDDDNGKFIFVNERSNEPRISIDSNLPDGFECYILNNKGIDLEESPDNYLRITPEYNNEPMLTVPITYYTPLTYISNYGIVHIVKRSTNLYTVNGDLYDYQT